MKVVITAATANEWKPSFDEINNSYGNRKLKITFHVSGVGLLATAFSLTKLIYEEKPGLILQVGIAGSFNLSIDLGKTLAVKEEILGDMGVKEDGKWKDIFDLQLENHNAHPFEQKTLPNPYFDQLNILKLQAVKAVTVNEVTTDVSRIAALVEKYNPVLESMEGAALHFVCSKLNTPFFQIRAACNYIGERDKSKWKITEAVANLNQTLLKFLNELHRIV